MTFSLTAQYNSTPPTVGNKQHSELQIDATGRLLVSPGGDVASAAADSGNPVKIGAVFNTTPAAVTNGQRVNLQASANGYLRNIIMGSATAEIVGLSDNADAVATTATTTRLATISRNTAFSTANNWGRVMQAGTGLGLYTERGPYSYNRRIADGQVKATAGFLHTITVAPTGTPAAGVLTIYDSASETGTVIFSCALPASVFLPFTVTIDAPFTTGLYCGFDGTLTNTQVTFSYR